MKIKEGEISEIPSKPSTGFVALLAKHRIQLDPSFNLRSGRAKLQALARAIIEALGGKQGDDGFEVDLPIVDIDVTLGAAQERVATLEAQVADLKVQLEACKKDYESVLLVVKGVTDQYSDTSSLLSELFRRVEKLEKPEAAPKRAKPEAKPDEAK